MTILWRGTFSSTIRNSCIFQTRRWNVFESVLLSCESEGQSRIQYVCSEQAVTGDRVGMLLSCNSADMCPSPPATERNRSIKLKCWERISVWHQEAPLFRHVLILLPVRGLLRKCYFWIDFIFYFFFFSSPHMNSDDAGSKCS